MDVAVVQVLAAEVAQAVAQAVVQAVVQVAVVAMAVATRRLTHALFLLEPTCWDISLTKKKR